jgi:hypothetical protein
MVNAEREKFSYAGLIFKWDIVGMAKLVFLRMVSNNYRLANPFLKVKYVEIFIS